MTIVNSASPRLTILPMATNSARLVLMCGSHGIAKGELDPGAPENGVIVDLERARRNARGGRATLFWLRFVRAAGRANHDATTSLPTKR